MIHLPHRLFNQAFFMNEALALRQTALEVGRVLLIFFVGRYLIMVLAPRIAVAATIGGAQRLGLLHAARDQARVRTIIGLVRSVGGYALFFVCGVLLLRALDLDAISVVTSASVAGIAFGLGAQKLFRDVVSGFFIILEGQYDIGDYVTINGNVTGKIEEMGMRIVKVRDDSGKLVILSNGDIAQVSNQSRGAVTSTVDLGVPPGTDLNRVRGVVDEASRELFEQEGESLGLAKQPTLLGTVGGDSTRTIVRMLIQTEHAVQLPAASQAAHDKLYAKLLEGGITPY